MPKKYLISDLADKAGVTVRTIRYYSELGLLPEPDRPGKFAYYTQEHLDRLELIRRLKDYRLPLWEIEQVLKAPDTRELEKLLEKLEETSPQALETVLPAQKQEQPGSSAMDYIAHIMNAQQQINETIAMPLQIKSPASPRLRKQTPSVQWTHFEITPEIEIHCHQPLSPDQQKKLDILVEYATQLFT